MAELVEIMGISHSPNFPGQIADANPEPAIVEAARDYELMRQRMADSRPDVLVVIASDHLNQFFMDNMPAFLIGKAPRAEGPFPHEMRTFGIVSYRADVEVDVAKSMLQLAPKMGVDFSFSDEFRIDHAFTVPQIVARVFVVNLVLAGLALIAVAAHNAAVSLAMLSAGAAMILWLLATFATGKPGG